VPRGLRAWYFVLHDHFLHYPHQDFDLDVFHSSVVGVGVGVSPKFDERLDQPNGRKVSAR